AITGKNHFKGECPLCGRKGKYRCDNKNGTGSYICVCGSGDGWSLLSGFTGKEFKVLAAEVDQIIGNEYTADRTRVNPVRTTLAQQREKVSRKFAKLTSLRGTGADSYLKGRGINSLPAESVRYCDKQPVDGKNLQAIYALATDDRGELCYLHRTLLDGDKKAQAGGAAKKM
ncbi:TPA: DNA primase, partial [Klebsiella pneumoniae]|nr:DNA primase [Klebsiella pneumoniae]